MRVLRVGLGAAGMLIALYGGWLLLSRQRVDQVVQVGEWAVAGVLLHDLVLAPVLLALGWVGLRLRRRSLAVAGSLLLVIAGSLTVVAIPALVRDRLPNANPTLLDRDYVAGWAITLAVLLVVTSLAVWVGRSRRKGAHGPGTSG